MPITIEELKGRGGTDKNLTRKYLVSGTADEAEVLNTLLDTVPKYLAGMPFQGFGIKEDDDLDQTYFCEANYGFDEKKEPEEDAVEYRFNYQAPSFQVYQSLQTINSYAASGSAEDFKGAINVVTDGNKMRVEGFSLSPPPVTFSLIYYPANGTISPTYQLLIESLVGKVNSTTFKGRSAGSLMLAMAQGGARNNAGWSLELGFSYSPNLTNIPVGDITVGTKDGMDLLWAFYTDKPGTKLNLKVPKFAYVERIFYRDDFNKLAI